MTRRILIAALLCSVAAFADTAAIVPTGVSSGLDSRNFTTGWAFSLSNSISVTALGYFDADADGLLSNHNVGIFTSGGTLLVSAIVPNGVAGTLNGGYRYIGISPFALGAGSYVIGGLSIDSNDPIVYAASAFNPAAGITLDATDLFTFNDVLAFPDQHGNTYANPNFQFTSSAVPEPAVFSLMSLGLAGLGLLKLRQRR